MALIDTALTPRPNDVFERAVKSIWCGSPPVLVVRNLHTLRDLHAFIETRLADIKYPPEVSIETAFCFEDIPEAIPIFASAVKRMLEINAKQIQFLRSCDNCGLSKSCQKIVWGEGLSHNGLMIVGEAPGAEEDASGRPFVGSAGQTLRTLLLEEGVEPHHCRITNTVKCNPPDNRRPTQDEKRACREYLEGEVRLYRPKAIIAVGLTAAQNLLKTKYQMARLIAAAGEEGIPARIGTVMVPVFPCYHTSPLCVNRVPAAKAQIRETIRKAVEFVGWLGKIPF